MRKKYLKQVFIGLVGGVTMAAIVHVPATDALVLASTSFAETKDERPIHPSPANPGAQDFLTHSSDEKDSDAQNAADMESKATCPEVSMDSAPESAALKVFCKKPEWGAACAERCYTQNIPCAPLAVHPYKPSAGIGKLFSCNTLLIGYMCGFHYENGDDCYWPFGRKGLAMCSYSGSQ